MDINETTDPVITKLYPLIKSAHPCWTVVIYAIVFAILTIGGILLNVSVIFVTIRAKSLRDTAYILLAFYSGCEIVNLSGNFITIYTAFCGQYFMPFQLVHRLFAVPFFGSGCAINLMLFIGIERLYVVLFPLKNFNQKLFLAFTLQFNLIYIIVLIVFDPHLFGHGSKSNEVLANYFEFARVFLNSGKRNPIIFVGFIILISCVVVYTLIAVVIHCRKVFKAPLNGNSVQNQINVRIFRSLFAIISVNFGGYILVFLNIFAISPLIDDQMMAIWHSTQIGGIFMHISASSNAPILLFTSSEYRTAFEKEFAFLSKAIGCKKSPRIAPQN